MGSYRNAKEIQYISLGEEKIFFIFPGFQTMKNSEPDKKQEKPFI